MSVFLTECDTCEINFNKIDKSFTQDTDVKCFNIVQFQQLRTSVCLTILLNRLKETTYTYVHSYKTENVHKLKESHFFRVFCLKLLGV